MIGVLYIDLSKAFDDQILLKKMKFTISMQLPSIGFDVFLKIDRNK